QATRVFTKESGDKLNYIDNESKLYEAATCGSWQSVNEEIDGVDYIVKSLILTEEGQKSRLDVYKPDDDTVAFINMFKWVDDEFVYHLKYGLEK
ncbi:hypothetical protein N9D31_03970, partial [Oligoflexaceae bacterium]|nr:hypothetical protein [Oligoflexaceae bacterium]